jgi:hypothetical protein
VAVIGFGLTLAAAVALAPRADPAGARRDVGPQS